MFLWREVLNWWLETKTLKNIWMDAGLVEKIIAFSITLIFFYQLLLALAPPIHWDALAYHLELPQSYLHAGKFVFVPWNLFWGNPQVGEMLFTFAITLGRLQTAALLNVFFGIVFIIGLMGFTFRQTQRLLGFDRQTASKAAWVAAAAILAGFTASHELSGAYVDILAAPMGLGMLFCVFEWLHTNQIKWLNWAGVFLGLAVGVKYPSALLGLSVYILILIKVRPFRSTLISVLRSGFISLIVFFPWLIKNWIFTGNPLFPYVFPTQWASTLRVQSASVSTVAATPLILNFLFPFTSVLVGGENGLWFATELGIIVLWLGAIGCWLFWPKIEGKLMVFSLILVWVFVAGVGNYLWQFQQTRIYFGILLPVLGILAGAGWGFCQNWVVKGLRLRRILASLLILVMVLVCWQDTLEVVASEPLMPALGIQSNETYLENHLGWYALTMKDLNDLPKSSKVLMLWEPRGLYAPDFTQPDVWIDNWRMAYWTYHTPEAILQSWRSAGMTHLLYYKSGAGLIRSDDRLLGADGWRVLDDLLKSLPAPVSYGNVYLLYTINKN